jgi:hypothetical protein
MKRKGPTPAQRDQTSKEGLDLQRVYLHLKRSAASHARPAHASTHQDGFVVRIGRESIRKRRGGVPPKSDAKVETANVRNISSCDGCKAEFRIDERTTHLDHNEKGNRSNCKGGQPTDSCDAIDETKDQTKWHWQVHYVPRRTPARCERALLFLGMVV